MWSAISNPVRYVADKVLVGYRTGHQKKRALVRPVAKVPINNPKHWRERAEEARTVADQMNDPDSKRKMLRIAEDYGELARRAERRLKQQRQQQQQQQPKVPINDPKHWRERAEEARAVADVMTDEKTKKMMLRIANDYEELARRAELRLKEADKNLN